MKNIVDAHEYISIAEFADRAGISRQAVYQQLTKKLTQYVKVEKGKKLLNTQALSEVYGIKDCKQIDKEVCKDIDSQLIELLRQQMEEKDRQIAELHRLMATTQMQLTESQHRLQELEDKSREDMDQEEDQQNVAKDEKQKNVEEYDKDHRIEELEQEIERLEAERNLPWWKKIFN